VGPTFRDRDAAGEMLAGALRRYAGARDVVVLGLVRGGVPIAAVVAARLGVPLDVLVVRKLGVPWAPEVAFGALGPGCVQVVNEDVAARLEPSDVAVVVDREAAELVRRERFYRAGRPPLAVRGRVTVLVDDGLATGATARAAVAVARRLGAAWVVLAAPVGSVQACAALAVDADELVCLLRPAPFGAVSQHYRDFHQVSDAEVVVALASVGVSPDPPG
jgi:predicted phosphoribosyltransferase